MYKFHCLNPIAEVGLSQFSGEYEAEGTLEGVDAVLVRSAAMHELEFDKELKVIARAGAGVKIFRLTDVQKKELLYLIHREQMQMVLKNL